jgi:Fe-S-cluster-containing dehydrogenase component
MTEQLGFHHDARRCTGCRTCVMACRSENRLEPGLQFRDVFPYREDPHSPARHYLSVGCNHCEQPECLRVCTNGAYQKGPDGVVTHDPAKCTGCRLCTVACPHGAPRYSARQRKTFKCGLCPERRAAGEQPACVAACPTGALTVIDLRTFADPSALCTVPGFPGSALTRPSVRFTAPERREPDEC